MYNKIIVSKINKEIQQYLPQQMHDLIWFSVYLAYMFRPNGPSSGQQSLGIPRIQFCQNKQKKHEK
jgi:hypothetical protein